MFMVKMPFFSKDSSGVSKQGRQRETLYIYRVYLFSKILNVLKKKKEQKNTGI